MRLQTFKGYNAFPSLPLTWNSNKHLYFFISVTNLNICKYLKWHDYGLGFERL